MKLAFKPDFSVARPAGVLHGKCTSGIPDSPSTDDWEKLLDDLLSEGPRPPKVIILVDGLDECKYPEKESNDSADVELFLQRMKTILTRFPHVHFLCSSRQHVPVEDFFGEELLEDVSIAPEDTAQDISAFIQTELSFRESELAKLGRKSIFCKQ
jgi:hypothetical protein